LLNKLFSEKEPVEVDTWSNALGGPCIAQFKDELCNVAQKLSKPGHIPIEARYISDLNSAQLCTPDGGAIAQIRVYGECGVPYLMWVWDIDLPEGAHELFSGISIPVKFKVLTEQE